jgi:hypothetical protein
LILFSGRNLSEKVISIKRKRPKKASPRDIASHWKSALKTGFSMPETQQNHEPNNEPLSGSANPLLRPWLTPFETPPFAEIAPDQFLQAFE